MSGEGKGLRETDADIASTAAVFSGVSMPTTRRASIASGGITVGSVFPFDASPVSGELSFSPSGLSFAGPLVSVITRLHRLVPGAVRKQTLDATPIKI
jgi:hypothetical protein